jgi:hypothetical protein
MVQPYWLEQVDVESCAQGVGVPVQVVVLVDQ